MAEKRKSNQGELATMSFGEHLEEMRRRVIYSLLGLGVALLITMYYGRDLIAFIYAPLMEVQRQTNLPMQTYTRAPLSGLMVFLKVSLVAAILLASPWMLYQFWRFVSAGLYQTERKVAALLIGLSGVMTTLSLVFVYLLLLPAVLSFLIQFTTTYPVLVPQEKGVLSRVTHLFMKMNEKTFMLEKPGEVEASATRPGSTQPADNSQLQVPALASDPDHPIEGQIWFNQARNEMRYFHGGQTRVFTMTAPSAMIPMIDPSDYIREVTWLTLSTVAIFQIPVIMGMLGVVGIGSPQWLASKRRYVVIIIFLMAVFLTPSQDLFSNVALPMIAWFLFEVGLLVMRFFCWRRERLERQRELESE